MTSMVSTPDSTSGAGRAVRMLPIAANLLPVEIVEARRGRKVRRVVLSALSAFAAVLVAWYALASYQTGTARQDLAAAESQAQGLHRLQQQGSYAEVLSVQATSQQIGSLLSTVLAGDLQWSRLFVAAQRVAPRGVAITSITGSVLPVGGSSVTASTGATQLSVASGTTPIGSVTITGVAIGKPAVAAYGDALGKVAGLANPYLTAVTLQNDVLTFTIRLDIATAALGGRYSSTTTTGSGGN